jgi:hypothetical protein
VRAIFVFCALFPPVVSRSQLPTLRRTAMHRLCTGNKQLFSHQTHFHSSHAASPAQLGARH